MAVLAYCAVILLPFPTICKHNYALEPCNLIQFHRFLQPRMIYFQAFHAQIHVMLKPA